MNVENLQNRIFNAAETIRQSVDILEHTTTRWVDRARACIEMNSRHFQHLI